MKTNALPTLTGLIFGFGLPRMFETVARTPPGDRYRNFEDIIFVSFSLFILVFGILFKGYTHWFQILFLHFFRGIRLAFFSRLTFRSHK